MSHEEQQAYGVAIQLIDACIRQREGGTALILSGLGLTRLPPEIGQLAALRNLDLSTNQLTALPSEIACLSNLQRLSLRNNNFSFFPVEICQLSTLKQLDLSGNNLNALSVEIGQLSELRELSLSGNQIRTIPPEIGMLRGLSLLSLDNNQLSTLPAEFGQLNSLQQLRLNNNRLIAIPMETGNLITLTELFVDNNLLSTLPSEIGNLSELTRLHLDGNQLHSLPLSIKKLINLSQIGLHGNPHLGLSIEILGPSWQEVMLNGVKSRPPREVFDFYFSLWEQGNRPLNEVKLLLIGRGEAGKTSVSRALRSEPGTEKTAFNNEQKETPGIEIKAWNLTCQGADDVKVHLWDFAGQEITHETHRFFLTERSLYVVVLDGRGGQQMEEAEYWLSHVQKFGSRLEAVFDGIDAKGRKKIKVTEERSPMIVVLNKWDSPGPYDVEQRRLQREYPNIKAFVQTDCATGLGISTLRETICAVLEQMPTVRQKWPKSYFDVRQALTALSENPDAGSRKHFLNWDDYRKVCADCGVTEQPRQQSLAENLNALGVALYYGDDERLRDTRVLNPNWAANGLYGLVRGVNALPWKGKRGHLWAGEFAIVLTKGMEGMDPVRGAVIDDYPEERDGVKVHEFLLELMVDRELGFQTRTEKGQPLYLLPGLLTLDEPEPKDFDVAAHMQLAQVRFRYLYELLPAGVMSRFIVRTHALSEDGHRWQRGVVLSWGNARALVMVERRRNPRMDIYITGGTAEERQELAGVVRSNMETIHRGLPEGLQGEEELDLSIPGEQYESVEKLVKLEEANQPVQIVTHAGPQQIEVTPQLEQVQPAKARRKGAPKLKVFVSYSHANYKLWDRLKTHLDILKNERLVCWWYDGKIRPGSEWDDAIRRELKEADIVILLLSNEFFASKYINGVELREAKRRQQIGEAEILPVLLEPSPAFVKQTWLKKLQTVPVVNGQLRPLSGFKPAVTGWNEVQVALRAIIAEVAERRRK